MRMLSYLKAAATTLMLSALIACSQNGQPPPDAPTTLAQIQADIRTTCGYVPTIASIAAVGATIASAINPGAGATATVVTATANAIVNRICDAVKEQKGKMSASPKASEDFVVTVNGVEVHGKLEGDKT
jgi:hypothetical protein